LPVINPSEKRVVLISSGQPSLNPRLVKEADALAETGYQVTVLYCYWNDWGTRYDALMFPEKKWRAVCIGGSPGQQPFIYFISRLIHKIARFASLKLNVNLFAELALARGSFFLSRQAPKYKADIYIGHNLGALPAAVKAAKKVGKPCGFDAEDFHRFELSDDVTDPDVRLKTFIEDKYLPQLTYLSTSSPLISVAYQKYYSVIKPLTLLNVFPSEENVPRVVVNETGPLRLFWFSQTIGLNRGIENVVKAIQQLKHLNIELHLLGFIGDGQKDDFINAMDAGEVNMIFHPPVPSDKIVEMASQFDIGLATETGVPANRDICLTNKIFTYMQAGLAILASDTSAQTALLEQYPAIGKVYNRDNVSSLANFLAAFADDRKKLLEARQQSLKTGRTILNWETESAKFISVIDKELHIHS